MLILKLYRIYYNIYSLRASIVYVQLSNPWPTDLYEKGFTGK